MSAAAVIVLLGGLATGPAFAASVSVSSGPNGTTVTSDQPCQVVTNGNSTSVTAGPNGVSGTTSTPGGSVTAGSGSSSNDGSGCVIHRNTK